MIGQLCLFLKTFRGAFPRRATFEWFVVAIFGFIVRLDHHGVSSSIFYYHFWTTAWRDPLGKTLTIKQLQDMDDRRKRLIARAMNAIEAFVNIALIATGLLQIITLEHSTKIRSLHHWWMRTYPPDVPSEEMVKTVIQHEFYHNFRKLEHTAIFQIIRAKRRKQEPDLFNMAA